jgi:hypothetical protein
MKKYIDDEGISADDYVDWFILLWNRKSYKTYGFIYP